MKKLLYTVVALCALAVAMPQTALAQVKKPIVNYHNNADAYIARQAEETFAVVDAALDAYPPIVGKSIERRISLYCLDQLLHDTRNDNSESFQAYLQSRTSKLLAELKKPVKSGMTVFKIYNEAFIAKTKDVTIAFDIVRGRSKGMPIVPEALLTQIVKKCDVLFLTHNHGDHVDRWVVNQFIAAGKPVIATNQILANVAGVTHFRDDYMMIQKQVKTKKGKVLNVKIYPGHQGANLENNVYAVTTPDGFTVAHTGDQHYRPDMSWIANVKNDTPQIDALIINCWTYKLPLAIEGFNPRYVFTGHENEMGHSIDHREAFWLTFSKLQDVKHDYIVTSWGEWFHIEK